MNAKGVCGIQRQSGGCRGVYLWEGGGVPSLLQCGVWNVLLSEISNSKALSVLGRSAEVVVVVVMVVMVVVVVVEDVEQQQSAAEKVEGESTAVSARITFDPAPRATTVCTKRTFQQQQQRWRCMGDGGRCRRGGVSAGGWILSKAAGDGSRWAAIDGRAGDLTQESRARSFESGGLSGLDRQLTVG